MSVCACVRAFVCSCVRAFVRACVRACVCETESYSIIGKSVSLSIPSSVELEISRSSDPSDSME